jgi:hypothetical protein
LGAGLKLKAYDPLSYYRLEILADCEITPFYTPKIIEMSCAAGFEEYGNYWVKRLADQMAILGENDASVQFSDPDLFQNIKLENTEKIDQLNQFAKENNLKKLPEKYVDESVEIKIKISCELVLKTGRQAKMLVLDPKKIKGGSLILNFTSDISVTPSHKSPITRYFNKFISCNQEIDFSQFSFIRLKGNKDLVSQNLLKQIQEKFKGVAIQNLLS